MVVRALEINAEVMVVDEGSTDRGINSLTGLNVHILNHPVNLGKGAAILTAAKACRQMGMTHLVTVDADGQHNPDDFRRFVPVMQRNPYAIVVRNNFV